MPLLAVWIVVLILLALRALPVWPYNRAWAKKPPGFYSYGGLVLVAVALICLLLTHRK